MNPSFELDRFLLAQQNVIERVREELRSGRKQSHWMWFIFPQLRGLGSSSHATWFGIPGSAEAAQYLAHPILGQRLIECTQLVNNVTGASATAIFGPIDAMKFRSCLTLFAQVAGPNSVFTEALTKHFDAEPDSLTLELLQTAEAE